MPELSPELVERFYAILAILAIAAIAIVILLRVLAIQSEPALDENRGDDRASERRLTRG